MRRVVFSGVQMGLSRAEIARICFFFFFFLFIFFPSVKKNLYVFEVVFVKQCWYQSGIKPSVVPHWGGWKMNKLWFASGSAREPRGAANQTFGVGVGVSLH